MLKKDFEISVTAVGVLLLLCIGMPETLFEDLQNKNQNI